MPNRRLAVVATIFLSALAPVGATAQQDQIPDIDYEHLAFRGIGLDVGYMWPDRVEATETFGMRFDFGYAGPGLRIMPSIGFWRSPLEGAEIAGFETRLEQLVEEQTGIPTTLDLGSIEYTNIALGLDGHIVWSLPFGLLTYGGLGFAAHIQNGDGPAINGTFVEDLLDSVRAGINAHLGLEFPLHPRLRVVGESRFELLENLRYGQLRLGGQFTFGALAPGEG
jgi:hypothetical protein